MPSTKLYLKILIDKVELLIKRMRWKALLFENETKSIFNYGFKIRKCPPQHKDLMKFEDHLQKIISIIQFRTVNNDFQNRLKDDKDQSSRRKRYLFLQIKQTFTKWKNHITKNF